MKLNQIFELSMVLDNEKFQKVFDRSYSEDVCTYEYDEEYIDHSLSGKGITVIYRNSQYKKKVRLIVNTYLLTDQAADTDKLIRKLGKRIGEYFDYKCDLEDFTLSGFSVVADIDVGTLTNTRAYLKVLKRIGKVKKFSPFSFDGFDDNDSFCLSGNSNGIDFLLYDLAAAITRQSKASYVDRKKVRSINGVIRSEVRLTKPKAIQAYTDAEDTKRQIKHLLKNSHDIFMDTFTQVIPFGDLYKKDKAVDIVRKEIADSVMRRRMLRLIALIPDKKSVHLAQKSMNCRDIEKVMEAFAKINLSPVTISKRSAEKNLMNLYDFIR